MEEKDTILFFHGWGLSPYSYKKITSNLSKRYRVISPKINFLDYETQLKEIEKQIKGKVIIISHSAGSVIAGEFAKKFPLKVKRIILLSPAGFSVRSFQNWIFSWFMHLTNIVMKHPGISSRITFDFFITSILHPQYAAKSMRKLSRVKLNGFTNKTLAIFADNDKLVPLPSENNVVKFEEVKGDHYWVFENQKELIRRLELEKKINL